MKKLIAIILLVLIIGGAIFIPYLWKKMINNSSSVATRSDNTSTRGTPPTDTRAPFSTLGAPPATDTPPATTPPQPQPTVTVDENKLSLKGWEDCGDRITPPSSGLYASNPWVDKLIAENKIRRWIKLKDLGNHDPIPLTQSMGFEITTSKPILWKVIIEESPGKDHKAEIKQILLPVPEGGSIKDQMMVTEKRELINNTWTEWSGIVGQERVDFFNKISSASFDRHPDYKDSSKEITVEIGFFFRSKEPIKPVQPKVEKEDKPKPSNPEAIII